MSTEPEKKTFGILNSLKKLIFEDATDSSASKPVEVPVPTAQNNTNTPAGSANSNPTPTPATVNLPVTDIKQMKVKVLGILEKLNEPGLDFFEVWNAAAEMGSIDANTIKAAYTSLKYVEKTLDKEKLLSSGRNYATALKKVIDQESAQKQQQKQDIEESQVQEKESLVNEIKLIEQNIADLKLKLESKEKDLKGINAKYEPQLKDIDQKIALGNTAVSEVTNDIEKALNIIESNIN